MDAPTFSFQIFRQTPLEEFKTVMEKSVETYRSRDLQNLLIRAVEVGNLAIMNDLFDRDANLIKTNIVKPKTAFWYLCSGPILNYIIHSYFSTESIEDSPCYADKKGDLLAAARLVCQRGANVNLNRCESTPLWKVAKKETDTEMLELLFDYGAISPTFDLKMLTEDKKNEIQRLSKIIKQAWADYLIKCHRYVFDFVFNSDHLPKEVNMYIARILISFYVNPIANLPDLD